MTTREPNLLESLNTTLRKLQAEARRQRVLVAQLKSSLFASTEQNDPAAKPPPEPPITSIKAGTVTLGEVVGEFRKLTKALDSVAQRIGDPKLLNRPEVVDDGPLQ